jgi:hypothetical protein
MTGVVTPGMPESQASASPFEKLDLPWRRLPPEKQAAERRKPGGNVIPK